MVYLLLFSVSKKSGYFSGLSRIKLSVGKLALSLLPGCLRAGCALVVAAFM